MHVNKYCIYSTYTVSTYMCPHIYIYIHIYIYTDLHIIHVYTCAGRSISLPQTFALILRVSCLMKHFLRIFATANRRLDDVGGELSAARD